MLILVGMQGFEYARRALIIASLGISCGSDKIFRSGRGSMKSGSCGSSLRVQSSAFPKYFDDWEFGLSAFGIGKLQNIAKQTTLL